LGGWILKDEEIRDAWQNARLEARQERASSIESEE
jgi:hypothetical protein